MGEERKRELKILFTICGRAGSKGIKNKNLRFFCGKPLAYFTVSVIDLYLRQHDGIALGSVLIPHSHPSYNITLFTTEYGAE